VFIHTQTSETQFSEGQSPLLRPADLPPPDHAIRLCPWTLESPDVSAQVSQMNEEFSPYTLDVCFLLVDAPVGDLQKALTQLGEEFKSLATSAVEQDNGMLLAVWAKEHQTVIGFFDNGGSDLAQQLGVTSTALDEFDVTEGVVRHFTMDTSQDEFVPFKGFFDELEPNRTLVALPHVLPTPVRPRVKR
jgi:hypothetical protein